MQKNRLLVALGFISIIFIWKNYIPSSSITGQYVNNNTEPILGGPNPIQNGKDTLILFDNGIFQSKTWGNGTYTILRSLMETKIKLSYTYSLGEAGFSTQIEKSILGETRIWLSHDLGFYFKKID